MIGKEMETQHGQGKKMNKTVEQIAVFDYKFTHQQGKVKYTFDVYQNKSSIITEPAETKYIPEKKYTGSFFVTSEKEIIYEVE